MASEPKENTMLNLDETEHPARTASVCCDPRVAALLDLTGHVLVAIDQVLERNERVMAEVRAA